MVQILQLCLPRSVCFHIPHVTHVPLGGVRPCVRFASWIKMSAGGTQIGRAAIAEFMNVKTMVPRSQARDLYLDLYAICDFSKRDGAAHFVVAGGMKHCNRL